MKSHCGYLLQRQDGPNNHAIPLLYSRREELAARHMHRCADQAKKDRSIVGALPSQPSPDRATYALHDRPRLPPDEDSPLVYLRDGDIAGRRLHLCHLERIPRPPPPPRGWFAWSSAPHHCSPEPEERILSTWSITDLEEISAVVVAAAAQPAAPLTPRSAPRSAAKQASVLDELHLHLKARGGPRDYLKALTTGCGDSGGYVSSVSPTSVLDSELMQRG